MQLINNTNVYAVSNGMAILDPMGLTFFPSQAGATPRLVKGEVLLLACEIFDYYAADPELQEMIHERWPRREETIEDVPAEPAPA